MKMLYITHLSGIRVNRFWLSAIQAIQALGGTFHIACNMKYADKEKWKKDCEKYKIISHQIDFNRSPFALENVTAYRQLKKLILKEKFDIVLGRLVAFKTDVPKIIYQAHGFHFYKGAPIINWLLFYSVEWIMARITDVLLTINREDAIVASRFNLHKDGYTKMVHGVGIDIPDLGKKKLVREQIRKDLGINDSTKLFIAVGELIKRKNQRTIIEAFKKAIITDSFLLICGAGPLRNKLQKQIDSYGDSQNIRLLGYREDVLAILQAADVFVISSLQEGLPVALMEAMAAELPCIASDIRGNRDLLGGHSALLFNPKDVNALAKAMIVALSDSKHEGKINRQIVKKYDTDTVIKELINVYS